MSSAPSAQATSRRALDRAQEFSRIIAILHKWGIHNLGALAALPPDQLGARLGPLAVHLWEQATGRATRILRLVRPTEVFAEQIEFEHEIETAEPLLFVLHRFLEQLTRRLGALYLVAQELTLDLTLADKSHYQHGFHLPDPTCSEEILFRLLQTHLETFRSEQPIVGAALTMVAAQPGRQQFHLFETPLRDPRRLHETLTRLTGLLGKERVGTPVLEDSHRADAFALRPFVWAWSDLPNDSDPRIGPALRRLRLPLSPQIASVVAGDAVPGRRRRSTAGVTAPGYDWTTGDSVPGYNGAVRARQGPYRTSGDWWDKQKWERTEWDLELADGAVCRCREGAGEWMPEGIYD